MTVFTDTAAERAVLVTLEPYDPASDGTVTLYVGTHGIATAPTDTPANAYFEPNLREGLAFKRSMLGSGRVGGRSLPERGGIVLVNTGEFDGWLDYHWSNRAVTVLMGLAGGAFADFETVFTGVCGELRYGRNQIAVPVFDNARLLDKPVQETLYAGTGGNEGGDDLKDKPKPLCFGQCLNVSAVPVDLTNKVYQVHDGQMEAIDAVYDNGKLLTLTTDYTVDLTNGRFTLVSAANGLVTADVKGDKTGGTYVSSAATVMRRVATVYGGLADPGDLDTASFTALDTKTTAIIGLYTGTMARGVLSILDDVADSIGGFWTFSRSGELEVGRLDAPSGTAALDIGENDVVENSVTREAFGNPIWRYRLDHRRCWTVQNADVLDPATTDAFKEFAGTEYRTASVEDTDVKEDGAGKDGHKGAEDLEPVPSLLVVTADAETEAARRLALFKTRREVFHEALKGVGFSLALGDVVTLTHSRFGLSAGKDFVVVGQEENASATAVELDLWG